MILSAQWVAIMTIVSSTVIGALVLRVIRSRRHVRENPVPDEVREKSHEVANEATKLRAGLRMIAKSQDPLAELVTKMRSSRPNV